MRLFVALDLPDAVRQPLAAWRPTVPGARWTPPDHLHLTLRFLGETPPEQADAVLDQLAGLKASAVPVRVGEPLRLPSARRPRVLAVRIADSSALARLDRQLAAALARVGVSPPGRPLLPHVSLARFRAPDGAALRKALRGAAPPQAEGIASSVSLVQSEPGPEGSVYTVLHRTALAETPGGSDG